MIAYQDFSQLPVMTPEEVFQSHFSNNRARFRAGGNEYVLGSRFKVGGKMIVAAFRVDKNGNVKDIDTLSAHNATPSPLGNKNYFKTSSLYSVAQMTLPNIVWVVRQLAGSSNEGDIRKAIERLFNARLLAVRDVRVDMQNGLKELNLYDKLPQRFKRELDFCPRDDAGRGPVTELLTECITVHLKNVK